MIVHRNHLYFLVKGCIVSQRKVSHVPCAILGMTQAQTSWCAFHKAKSKHFCRIHSPLLPYIHSQHWHNYHVLTNLWLWTPISSLLVHHPWGHLASFLQGLESDILHSNNAVLQENNVVHYQYKLREVQLTDTSWVLSNLHLQPPFSE